MELVTSLNKHRESLSQLTKTCLQDYIDQVQCTLNLSILSRQIGGYDQK